MCGLVDAVWAHRSVTRVSEHVWAGGRCVGSPVCNKSERACVGWWTLCGLVDVKLTLNWKSLPLMSSCWPERPSAENGICKTYFLDGKAKVLAAMPA